ncbi:MAG: hypothetical protein BWY69_00638 [Planctomycetes bacterium ADurb.Bin401]|nr:MAG: hypothetical protein BWY69_00638 [Planctomycetes bacterium ADurb.Bin401]
MQLEVIKADGSQEPYLHTKVIATFVNAFVEPAEKNTFLASQLAESVTFYLYNNHGSDTVTSSEIFSIIKAVLSSTGFDFAAQIISEHHCRRNLLRSRVQVVKKSPGSDNIAENTVAWNKSKIISDLIAEHNLDSATARTIASLVEEKILNSGFNLVPTDFIKFLMLWLMQTFVNTDPQNVTMHRKKENILNMNSNAVMDDRLRQQQNGLCPV